MRLCEGAGSVQKASPSSTSYARPCPAHLSRSTRHSRLWSRSRPLVCVNTIGVPEEPRGRDLGWRTDFPKHYVKGKLIGAGSFGFVYLGIDLRSGQEVAIKVMPKVRGKLSKERTLQKLLKEVTILERLQDCPNVVRLEGCFEADNEVQIVTEMCNGGDLQKLSDENGPLSERIVALIGYEVLKVVHACHNKGIVHGDVKPANFVLKHKTKNPLCSANPALLTTPWLRAIDFGCSQLLDGEERFSKRTGTPVYMAPEIFERDYSWECDMWSVGMMLYQLYANRFPFWDTYSTCKQAKLDEVASLVMDAPISYSYGPWPRMSKEGKDFIQLCLDRDYVQRITVEEGLEHPWFIKFIPSEERFVDGASESNNIVPKGQAVRERQTVH